MTGSSRGIGKAIALALAREGADIGINYVADPSGTNLAQAGEAKELIERLGRKAVVLQADVANQDGVRRMVADFLAAFGKMDILINNAGIVRDMTLKNMPKEAWDAVIAVNLTGVFNCTSAVVNHMRERGTGRIISIASIIGQTGNIGQSNYSASKAGVIGFTKSVAREVARKGITVNAIAPGFIETDMLKGVPEEIRKRVLQEIPLARFGAPEDVAGAAVFLASDSASYITGQVLNVNGGLFM